MSGPGLAVHIRQLMHNVGIVSVNELSRRAGVTLSVLQAIMSGRSVPRPATVRKLSDFFGVSASVLISELSGTDIGVTSFNSIAEVLRYLIQDICVSQRELERLTGVPQQLINNILHGHTEKPREATVKRLAEFFGVSPQQLMAQAPLDRYRKKGATSEQIASHGTVPLLAWQQLMLLPQALNAVAMERVACRYAGSGLFATTVPNLRMMEPLVRPGDLLIVEHGCSFSNGNTFIVQTFNASLVMGDYFRRGRCERLSFADPSEESMALNPGQYRNIGRVLEVRKQNDARAITPPAKTD